MTDGPDRRSSARGPAGAAPEPSGADRPVSAAPATPPPHAAATITSSDPLSMTAGARDDTPVSGAGAPEPGAGGRVRLGDRVFLWMTTAASGFVIALVVLIAVFLVIKSVPSIMDDKVNFLTSTQWDTTPGNLRFGVAALLYTTVAISLVALIIAVPLAIGIALFITQYAPRRIARPIAYVIDLLAAIPSIIYGIWGARELAPRLTGTQDVIGSIGLGLFGDKGIATGTVFDGAIVLAIMILPIITAISRDVFERTPRANIEAAWALGATKWEMIRVAVLPYGRAGVVSGSMLGLGRALGETIAIYLILSKVSVFSPSILSGGETFASKIANNAQEFSNPSSTGAYIAAGLVLFVLTFVVNATARGIVNRRKDFS